ncbi:MAG: bifunctional phosphoribosylaminoimidazolecarboxamide formyltransferase/inosine monophosphate cyclohydrolase [Bacteroidetes bacterium 4572_128]|nr:MAG: bifunctional phosphoribosylaminoimidazolecarboxamide formyltransferase/inosine monophosphate cyclohydrolase [Bacteroidetes bacterium 4572_128]
MKNLKKIKSALISVFYKKNLEKIVRKLNDLNVQIISTGGTEKFIKNLGVKVTSVENITSFPEIMDGRVKTLHPKIFGGILARNENKNDKKQLEKFNIPNIDLVIVDLYPFEETVRNSKSEDEIIEKIDIGGISLIRASAKNYKDVFVVSSQNQYLEFIKILDKNNGITSIEERKEFARKSFSISSDYDRNILNYFSKKNILRYGENPHQEAYFSGNLEKIFNKLNGKKISYNNLLDIDAALNLISEFEETTFAILKHNISAFGGVLVCNKNLDKKTAEEINKIFFEVIIAPSYEEDALEILKQKKNRIILVLKGNKNFKKEQFRTILNGFLYQEKDLKTEEKIDLKTVTKIFPESKEVSDLLFANKIVKHTKSNAIVLAKNKQLLSSGVGQTSRVDALKQAIAKAKHFNFDLENSVMASDAFFPFSDSVEIAYNSGIRFVIQPGGSIRDKSVIKFCDEKKMSMVFTGTRHFKH